MAALVLNGDTSGTITLAAPAVAGATTLTLPATSGTVALLSNIQPAIGVGQTWQEFTVPSQRTDGVNYTNDTGRPICVNIRLARDDGVIELWVDGFMLGKIGDTAGPAAISLNIIVPAGSTYRAEIDGATLFWYELR